MASTHRTLYMLSMIPRAPRKISTTELMSRLKAHGFFVDVRTVQRDLNTLSLSFSIVRDECRPAGWSWAKDAKVIDIPGMDPHTALTFKLVEEFIKDLLPKSTLSYLDGHLKQASQLLTQSKPEGLSSWPQKVRTLPRGLPLTPPKIDPDVLDVVYTALFNEVAFTALYRRRKDKQRKRYLVNPLGLVYRSGVAYLLCTFDDHSEVRQLVLHRMVSAKLSDTPSQAPTNFDLDQYIAEGGFGYLQSGDKIELKALFKTEAAKHLAETPLSSDQVIRVVDDDEVLVIATVPDTSELRWWLQGFGNNVTVLRPKSLRREFKNLIKQMQKNYSHKSREYLLDE